MGIESIDFLKISDNSSLNKVGLKKIPVIDFKTLTNIDSTLIYEHSENDHNTVLIPSNGSQNIYAVVLHDDSMSPEFENGNILIMNKKIEPKDGNYVILKHKGKVILREFRIIGGKHFIQTYKPKLHAEELIQDYEFLGVVIETRRSFSAK